MTEICKIDSFIEKVRDEYIKDLNDIISVPSVLSDAVGEKVFGENVAKALEVILSMGKKYGFECENIDYRCGKITLKTNNKKPTPYKEGYENEVGIVGHIDVVPAESATWSCNPFALTVKDGLLIGRGTEDDKGPLIAAMYAMRYIKEECKMDLPFDISIIAGCNEETGMKDLPYYLKKYNAPFFSVTPDASFPVCIGEKGISTFYITIPHCLTKIKSFTAGTVKNAVAGHAVAEFYQDVNLTEKENITVCGKKVSAEGVTAHAAIPESGVNAIGLLAEYLLDNADLSEKEKSAFEFLKNAAFDYKGEVLGINCSDEPSGYLTCVAGVTTTDGDSLTQSFNIRLPVTKSWDTVSEALNKFCKKNGFILKDTGNSKPYYRPADSKEVKMLLNCYREVTKDDSAPYTIGGGTYAKIFPNTYVFGAVQSKYSSILGAGKGGAHENDEYLSVKEFEDCIKIFVKMFLELSRD